MTQQRVTRAKKLIAVREHALRRAEGSFAAAERDARERRDLAALEVASWLDAVARANLVREAPAGELVLARQGVVYAQHQVERRERDLEQAVGRVEQTGEALVAARRGLRQMELFAESIVEVVRTEERAADRTHSDELAAGMKRRVSR